MIIEEALKRHLKLQAGLTALVGTGDSCRLYYVTAPQDVAAPYIVFFKVAASREHSHSGPSGLARALFQFSVFGATYTESKLIVAQLQLALDGKNEVIGGSGGVRAVILNDNETDLYEDSLFHIAVDYIVWHEE
jgi:hypothetical protein